MAATFQMLQQIDGNFPLTPIQFYNLADRGLPLFICLFLGDGPAIDFRNSLQKFLAHGTRFRTAGSCFSPA